MKINIIIIGLALILSVSLFTGCKKSSEDIPKVVDVEQEKDANDESNQGITVNPIKFEVIDINTLQVQLINEVEILKLNKGYAYWEQENGSYLIFISAGEKNTGGYSVEVKSIEDNEGKTVISIMENVPAADAMVTEAITYPYIIVKTTGITDQFIIRDQNQSEYTLITPQVGNTEDASGTMLRIDENSIDFSQPIAGIYQGQMDNHTIEVLVGDIYMPFTSDNIEKYLEGIEEGDSIEITVSISPSDQWIVEDIVKIQ